jgi:iron complex transport system permease protein
VSGASSPAKARVGLMFLLVCALLVLSMVSAVTLGDAHLSVPQVVMALRHGPNGPSGDDQIVWLVRLPRIVMAALVGASLAGAGLAFQSLLRNDLADPYLIGVSAGASVGAEAVLLRGAEALWRGFAVPMASFLSATAAMAVVYSLARRGGRVLVTSLLLGGVVVSAFLGSISTLLLELGHAEDAQRIQYRLNGSLEDATFTQCGVVLLFLALGVLVLMLEARHMNLFALGEESAQQLGLEVEQFKTVLILTGALLTAATVAFAGIIGFVGLMVPHLARRLAGTPDHRRVLPLALTTGGVLMVWADTLARIALPDGRELPVGLVTALLGAPFFCYLLRRQSRFR